MTWLTDELSINVSISSVRHLCVKQLYGFVKVVVHCIFWHQPIKHDNIVKLVKNGWPNAYNWLKIDGLILQIFCTLSGRTGSVRSITFISLYVVFIGFQNFISICMSSLLHCLHCQFLVRPFFRWRYNLITNWTSFTCPFDVGSLRAPERKRGTPIRHGNKHVFENEGGSTVINGYSTNFWEFGKWFDFWIIKILWLWATTQLVKQKLRTTALSDLRCSCQCHENVCRFVQIFRINFVSIAMCLMSQLFRRAKDSEFPSCAMPGRTEIPDANMDPNSVLGVCDSIIFVVSCFLIYCILLWCLGWCVFYFVRRFFYVNWWFGGLLSEYSGWKSFDEKTLFNLESSMFNLLDNVPRRQVPWHADGGNGGFGSIKVSATFEDSTWAQIFAEKRWNDGRIVEGEMDEIEKIKDIPEFMNFGNSFHGIKPQLSRIAFIR